MSRIVADDRGRWTGGPQRDQRRAAQANQVLLFDHVAFGRCLLKGGRGVGAAVQNYAGSSTFSGAGVDRWWFTRLW